MPGQALLRRLQYVFWAAGLLLGGLVAGAYLEARYLQARENLRLEDALQSRGPASMADGSRHAAAPRTVGSLVGRLEIPRLRLSAIVLEGSDSRTLRVAVGRLPETGDAGEVGNVVLSGHRDTFFRPLRKIRAGDRVVLTTPDGAYRYVVEWTTVVNPSDNSSLKATSDRSLTLVTCYPFRYIGPAPQRFIVRARQLAAGVSTAGND
jgi:sortase A